jgi:alanine racemase
MTALQLQRFASLTGDAGLMCSIANSAALLAIPAARAQWVRPGLALYGASPFADQSAASLGLVPAMSLETSVIATRRVLAGESIGYGGAWRAPRDTQVAILAAGYGDGLPRNLATGTPVLVNERRAPLVGRVSMDMIAVDVTDRADVRVGDGVVLWGPDLPVEEIAACAATIPYELLCSVSQRVPLAFV